MNPGGVVPLSLCVPLRGAFCSFEMKLVQFVLEAAVGTDDPDSNSRRA